MSDTKNVKLGVCKAFFDGNDLGYTKGGVEVTVTTETHKVEIDQFGKTPINEYIMGRSVQAKVPLAETTLDNMVRIMPGATLTETGGSKATGTITIATNPADGETILVNGATFTFKTVAAGANDVAIGGTSNVTATNLAAKLNSSVIASVAKADYTAATNVVTVTYGSKSVAGNGFTLATGTAGVKVTMSGATLAGGADVTEAYVEVTSGVGTDLLSIAKELRLHPVALPDNDYSEDFVIPLTATAGALNFAYKLEDERVYNVEFNGYPDPVTNKLFYVGKAPV